MHGVCEIYLIIYCDAVMPTDNEKFELKKKRRKREKPNACRQLMNKIKSQLNRLFDDKPSDLT